MPFSVDEALSSCALHVIYNSFDSPRIESGKDPQINGFLWGFATFLFWALFLNVSHLSKPHTFPDDRVGDSISRASEGKHNYPSRGVILRKMLRRDAN